MKPTVFLILLISFFGCSAQKSDSKFDFDKRIKIAHITTNGKIEFIIDNVDFLNILNQKLYKGEKMLDRLTIENGVSSGIKEVPFHYLSAISITKNLQVVRYLISDGENLYLDVVANGEFFSFETFFVACEGTSVCSPRLFYTNNGCIWSCRESYNCVSPEQAESDKCSITTTLF